MVSDSSLENQHHQQCLAWSSGCRVKAEQLLPCSSMGNKGPDASKGLTAGLLRQRTGVGSSKEPSKRVSWSVNRLLQRAAGAQPREEQASSQGWKAPVGRAGGRKGSPRDRVFNETGSPSGPRELEAGPRRHVLLGCPPCSLSSAPSLLFLVLKESEMPGEQLGYEGVESKAGKRGSNCTSPLWGGLLSAMAPAAPCLAQSTKLEYRGDRLHPIRPFH